MLCVQVISEKRFRRRLIEGREEITVCGQKAYKVRGISTPLLFRSKGFSVDIYIPEEIMENEKLVSHAILHENTHKKHGDIWWGYLRNLLLAAYWFHPLLWVAAFCSKTDCEYACDSSIIGRMSREERISYGNSLLSLVQAGREENPFNTATPMSVKESELKRRICLVKRGKKRGTVATVLTSVLIVVVVVSTFTGAKEGTLESGMRRQKETKEKSPESAVHAETENTAELTMEKFIESYNNKKFLKWGIQDVLRYENMSEIQKTDSEGLRYFEGELSYQGIDYQLQMDYSQGELAAVSLEHKETGESNYIYLKNRKRFKDKFVSLEKFLSQGSTATKKEKN